MLGKRDVKFLKHDVMFFSSGTASDSICPKGWRLPGYSGDGSYWDLVRNYNNGAVNHINADTIMIVAPLSFFHFGYYRTRPSAYNVESGYWLNFTSSLTKAYIQYFNNSGSLTRGADSRNVGFTLRCLAR